MEIHYSRHAAAYCTSLNKAVQENQIDISEGLEFILSNVSAYPVSVRNNGGGHYNHELFWNCMKPGGSTLQESTLKEKIIGTFGSLDDFQNLFSNAALGRFGSGWTWLIISGDGRLVIESTPNQDNPLMDISPIKGFPLLGLDVWEHAYYLRYQNRRAEYINKWWSIVDWSFVSQRFLNYTSVRK
jgi:Fe-Mn family superoxide dismutase